MSLITELKTLAYPDYRLLEIRDSDTIVTDDEAADASRTRVVVGSGPHIYISSLQRDIDVQVTIRIWDSPQEPPTDVEGHTQVSFESPTGLISVDQLTMGSAAFMALPCPGVYEGHAAWTNRQATSDYVDECMDRSLEEDWDSIQTRQAWNECPVLEEYTIDLWHQGRFKVNAGKIGP
ncbi:hypothetical protein ACFWSF_26365 [Streptomyces sp. NPDC058611]|uniref:hypothetical protein n=1 Tax=unclassified Streptomyces TaxID=2593676 RepID=UPI00366420D0